MEKNDKGREQKPHVSPAAHNAGSAGFNQGAEQEPDYNDGVADGPEHPEWISKEIQNPMTKLSDKDIRDNEKAKRGQ